MAFRGSIVVARNGTRQLATPLAACFRQLSGKQPYTQGAYHRVHDVAAFAGQARQTELPEGPSFAEFVSGNVPIPAKKLKKKQRCAMAACT